MRPKTTAIIGIIGALLFICTTVIGGFQFTYYNHLSQLISESYAFGTPYWLYLIIFGFVPSGVLLALFGFYAHTCFKKSSLLKLGFTGFAVFYGLGMIIVSIFPCDAGCTIELMDSSFSQIIHNVLSVAIYLVAPWCLIVVGFGLRKLKEGYVAPASMTLGVLSGIFVLVLFLNITSDFKGLFQRIIEGCILIWIFIIAAHILKKTKKR